MSCPRWNKNETQMRQEHALPGRRMFPSWVKIFTQVGNNQAPSGSQQNRAKEIGRKI